MGTQFNCQKVRCSYLIKMTVATDFYCMDSKSVSSQYVLDINTAESITLTSFSIPSTSLPGQFMQLRVNFLICLLKH